MTKELNNIIDYLSLHNIEYKEVGDNLTLDCPFCTDTRGRFGIHSESGAWNCFNCERKGKKLSTFKKAFENEKTFSSNLKHLASKPVDKSHSLDVDVERFHRLLNDSSSNRKAKQYLRYERGFSEEAIDYFQLGSTLKSSTEYLSIPFFEHNKLVNVKYRALGPIEKRYKWLRQKGGKSSLFNHGILLDKSVETIYVTEAELDAISLWSQGIKNVISVSVGANAFKGEWYKELTHIKKVYILFDSDIPGQDGAEKLAKRLGINRCYNIKLPENIKDVNDFFWDRESKKQNKTKEDFESIIKDSVKFDIKDVMSAESTLQNMMRKHLLGDPDEVHGLLSPWKKLNKLVSGVKPGQLITISATPKTGKTTFAMNWCNFLAKRNNGIFFYCLEMSGEELMANEIPKYNLDFISMDDVNEIQLIKTLHDFPTKNFWFGSTTNDKLDLDYVCEKITEVVEVYGVKVVVFDHLHFLIRGENVVSLVGECTRRFKLLAEKLGIVFFLVAQPKKIQNNFEMTEQDLKDSSSIFADSDLVIILHRNKKEETGHEVESDDGFLDEMTKVKVVGRRTKGGFFYAYFDQRRMNFLDECQELNDRLNKRQFKHQKRKRKIY